MASSETREPDDIALTGDQQSLVVRDFAGPARIRGVSGSGKTLVALRRAVRLASTGRPILFVTFNRSLARRVEEQIDELCAQAPETAQNIKACTLHAMQ